MPIRGKILRTSNAAVMQVFVDRIGSGAFSGRIFHQDTGYLTGFISVYDMIAKMDGVYDRISYPQTMYSYRAFTQKNTAQTQCNAREDNNTMNNDKEIIIEPAGKGTFIVRVMYRQNATWQGSIQWVEGKKTQNFRSDLEMLKLIDEALRKEGDDDMARWDE